MNIFDSLTFWSILLELSLLSLIFLMGYLMGILAASKNAYRALALTTVTDIQPETWISYLADSGWDKIPRKRKDVAVFQTVRNGELYQTTIPLDKQMSDYAYALKQALATIAEAEGQDEAAILSTLQNAQGDD